MPFRVIILGHSGIGKSPLARLFKIPGWEPFRVRQPRDARDALVCKSEEDATALEDNEKGFGPPVYQGGAPSNIRVYKRWSFFDVRGKKQCLEHTEAACRADQSIRVEIFSPVLVELLQNRVAVSSAIPLDPSLLVIVLLNPTARSVRDMTGPSVELCLATHAAIAERDRVLAKEVDLADNLRRVEHLQEELSSWRELLAVCCNAVECIAWPHFEYRYSLPRREVSHAQAELRRARGTLLAAVREQLPQVENELSSLLRSEDEIEHITAIV